MGVETWGNLVSGLFPRCFLDEDACSVPAAVVLHGGETHVSTVFPHCFHGFRTTNVDTYALVLSVGAGVSELAWCS